MTRSRLAVGTFGDINYQQTASGRIQARTRYRDDDGKVRFISAVGETRRAAERRLKESIATRTRRDAYAELTPDSSFGQLVEVWLEDLDLEGKLAANTRALYERNMRQLVLPAFEHLALREISTGRVDRFLKKLATTRSHSMAKQAKTVLSLAFGLAVRYDALARNPVRETARLRKPPRQTSAPTFEEIEAIRAAVRGWRREAGLSGPKPDGQLELIIEVMLGTSARIGEVLAIRRCDVDVTRRPATVRLSGTIVSPPRQPTFRQAHPKTAKSVRTMAVPAFTAEAIRQRLADVPADDPEHLLFFTRNGTPLTTNNVRRRLRTILETVGIEGVTPHSFRRTVATFLDRAGGAELAAEMLGHTSSAITKEHYIERDERVNPVTAEILESLSPRRDDLIDEESGSP
ncbi:MULTISPECIES: tyrosine-type recombinase/integrase [unclassified Aeromicrobium]|uniref:tyrosine-type recombinase/integrase n=1 Tax=unclassified Aeromicrobium TaxID=2633570 RepID=UPI00396B3CC3